MVVYMYMHVNTYIHTYIPYSLHVYIICRCLDVSVRVEIFEFVSVNVMHASISARLSACQYMHACKDNSAVTHIITCH